MLGISDIVHGWIPTESFRSTAFGSHWNKAMDGRKLSQHPIVKGPGILSYINALLGMCGEKGDEAKRRELVENNGV